MKNYSKQIFYHLFETSSGVAAIAWTCNGICGHHIPGKDDRTSEDRIKTMFPSAQLTKPPLEVEMIARRMCKHLLGNTQDFSNVRLDLGGIPLFQSVG
ncbi:MAG TPA: hypothetical protein PKZ32_17020 [Candidatus Melainabacteria bacterium]|nr:hypothetical protein [Candidatus Melainabacteria bacterium]